MQVVSEVKIDEKLNLKPEFKKWQPDHKTYPVITHVKDYFQGISHTLFFKNPIFGAIFLLIALLFNPFVYMCGIAASVIGYIFSVQTRTNKIIKYTGLMTINGLFFGIAFATLFQESVAFYVCLALGAFAVPLLTKGFFEVLQHWKLPALIAPYIMAIWTFWLCSAVISLPLSTDIWAQDQSILWNTWADLPTWARVAKTVFFSMGQIFFFRNSDFGLGLLLLISAFSPRRGIYFLAGTALATGTFYLLSNGNVPDKYSYFSYSAGLVGLGLAALPEDFSWRTIMMFCMISLFVTVATEQLFGHWGLPVLSLPYVLTFWFAYLSRGPRLNVAWARSGAHA